MPLWQIPSYGQRKNSCPWDSSLQMQTSKYNKIACDTSLRLPLKHEESRYFMFHTWSSFSLKRYPGKVQQKEVITGFLNQIQYWLCFVLFSFLFMLDLRQTKIGIAFAQVLEYRDYNWSMFYSFCTFSGFLFSKNIFKIIIWWEACFLQSCSHLLLGCRKRYQANNVLEVLFAFDFKIVIM